MTLCTTATTWMIYIVIMILIKIFCVYSFDEECNGVYDATTGIQLYPVDICEAERINGDSRSEVYFCDSGAVFLKYWAYSNNCKGSGYSVYPAYFPDDDSVDIVCNNNNSTNITTTCEYAIVRRYFEDGCQKGNVTAGADYNDETVPVNRCRYDSSQDESTMIKCNDTAIIETVYSGQNCQGINIEQTFVYTDGCNEDDYIDPITKVTIAAYDEIIYCPLTNTSKSNIVSITFTFIFGIFFIILT